MTLQTIEPPGHGSIWLLMNIWTFGLFPIYGYWGEKLLWTFVYKSVCRHVFPLISRRRNPLQISWVVSLKFSSVVCPENPSYLTLPVMWPVSVELLESARLCLRSSALECILEICPRSHRALSSGLFMPRNTVLLFLLPNDRTLVFHIFCLCFSCLTYESKPLPVTPSWLEEKLFSFILLIWKVIFFNWKGMQNSTGAFI